MPKIFIDGQVGTTGLQIADQLANRSDIEIIRIPDDQRKEIKVKKAFLNEADLVVLCLPDDAAVESTKLITNGSVKVLDASTAHRVDPNWVYGLPELKPGQREAIFSASRVSNPGCYPTGFLLALAPLVRSGVLPVDYPVTVNAVSGYSGGGRKLIESYQEHANESDDKSWSFRKYGLNLAHKHVPEMTKYSGLSYSPAFEPAVADVIQGMLVSIPLHLRLMRSGTSIKELHAILTKAYADEEFINVWEMNSEAALNKGFIAATDRNDTNEVDIFVYGNNHQAVVVARLDNLGKGASRAAIQNINLMLGLEETKGLV